MLDWVRATPPFAPCCRAGAPSVEVLGARGSGDCTIAGRALKVAYGEPLMEACRLAVDMGTAAVLTPGTELCRRADVARLLPQIKIWEIPTRRRAKVSFPVPS